MPTEKLLLTLAEIAQRHHDILQRLSALDFEDPVTKAAIDEAGTILSRADSMAAYDRADALLADAEASDMLASGKRRLSNEAQEAARRKRRSAAATRTERGEWSLTRLDYLQAAQHFKAAAEIVAVDEIELRVGYLNRCAAALDQYGDEKGDTRSWHRRLVSIERVFASCRGPNSSPTWARTQNDLGNALAKLGGRESGTARLEEAVAAYREALKERT